MEKLSFDRLGQYSIRINKQYRVCFSIDNQNDIENVEIVDYRLAKDILHGRWKVSVDTSIRLGRYFSVNDHYFLDLQNDIDIRNELRDTRAEFDRIKQLSRA